MDDVVCSEILKQDGVSWHFDRSSLNLDSLTIKEVLGVRDTPIKDHNCFMVVSAGGELLTYINMGRQRNPGRGMFSFGLFFNFPLGAASQECPIISWGNESGLYVYQNHGNIYVRVYDIANGVQEIDTVFSGINYCDGETHLLFFERDSRQDVAHLSIEIFESYKIELNIGSRNCANTENLYIGARLDGNEVVTQYGYPGTKFSGAFYLSGKSIDFVEKQLFWKNGVLPHNAEFFVHMDESVSKAIYDSDYQSNHGEIVNYVSESRSTLPDGFSWQNTYGFSTGVYVKGLGVSEINILGAPHTIEDGELLPFWSYVLSKDVAGQEVQYQGRCRINLQVKDIMCFKGNGVTSAELVVAHSYLDYIPGVDEFSIFWIAEKVDDFGGCIIANGEGPNWRYRFDYSSIASEITWNVGGSSGSVAVSEGMLYVIINIGTSTFEIFVNGSSLGVFSIGASVTSSEEFHLFALDDNTSILTGTSVVLVGSRGNLFTDFERADFFSSVKIPLDVDVCWLPCSNGEFIIDIANTYNASLINYVASVWTGKQSVCSHIFKGFTKILDDLNQDSDYVFVPYSLRGKKIPYLAFQANQIDSESVVKEGLVLFPCFIDFNPFNVDLGFFTYFWDKTKPHWVSLDSQYDGADKFYWHVYELNMSYFDSALTNAWWNFCFVDTTFDKYNLQIEIKDLLLLNLGNNQKYVPVPIHY